MKWYISIQYLFNIFKISPLYNPKIKVVVRIGPTSITDKKSFIFFDNTIEKIIKNINPVTNRYAKSFKLNIGIIRNKGNNSKNKISNKYLELDLK